MRTIALIMTAMVITSSPAWAGEWYQGGTLHRATLSDWRSASYSNRLATAADMAAATSKGRLRSMAELKKFAKALEICITEVAKARKLGSLKVSEIAASCVVLMKKN